MTEKVKSKKFKQIISQVPANYYDQGVKSNLLQRYWHSRKWSKVSGMINGSGKGKLLDVGCADGTTTYNIHRQFPDLEVWGVDCYAKAINYAKRTKHGINFLVADAHKLPFKNSTFDVVCAVETLEHLHEPDLALKEIHRVLRPSGILIIGQDTDSLLFKTIWWFWTKWKGSVWNNSHISCVAPDVLVSNVKKSGFKVNRVEFANLKMEVFVKAYKKNS